jgi:tetratricopeptide (TPR) repeat protein
MARAAAKRNKRPKQVARPQPAPASTSRSRDKSLEDQLFFGRLRGHAKWAFVLLAVVFGLGFVFLGVGSGSSGSLGDLFNNLFTGSSGPSIDKLQETVAKNPKDAASLLELGQALQSKQRLDEAIVAYERFVTLRPKSLQGLNQLAALYQQKSQLDAANVQAAVNQAQTASPDGLFGPAAGSPLGQALGAGQNSISRSLGDQANQAYQEAVSRYQATVSAELKTYQLIAKLSPDEPGAQLNVAQAARAAGDSQAALTAYKTFLTRFPDDPLAPDVRKQLRELQASLKSAGANGQSKTG